MAQTDFLKTRPFFWNFNFPAMSQTDISDFNKTEYAIEFIWMIFKIRLGSYPENLPIWFIGF